MKVGLFSPKNINRSRNIAGFVGVAVTAVGMVAIGLLGAYFKQDIGKTIGAVAVVGGGGAVLTGLTMWALAYKPRRIRNKETNRTFVLDQRGAQKLRSAMINSNTGVTEIFGHGGSEVTLDDATYRFARSSAAMPSEVPLTVRKDDGSQVEFLQLTGEDLAVLDTQLQGADRDALRARGDSVQVSEALFVILKTWLEERPERQNPTDPGTGVTVDDNGVMIIDV